jgi:hypothetical protein
MTPIRRIDGTMRLGRTIVALLIAVSVAMLPIAGGAVAAFNAAQFSAPATAHHGSPCDETSKAVDDCASIAVCAVKCFNYAGTVLPVVLVVPVGSLLYPVRDGRLLLSQIGSPPFRPPRV